jgi:rubrerythrin
MSILNILDKLNLEKISPEKMQQPSSRRELFGMFGTTGKTIAAGVVPFALTMMATKQAKAKAYVNLNGPVEDILNFALTLEYLEAEFYTLGLNASALIPNGKDRSIFQQISKHENAHVSFLQSALGSMAVAKPTFDFTAGGAFDTFGDYATFLALSQAFEDTGVRAYKGGAGGLMSDDAILTAALQIHSVEARHASEVRRLRGKRGWITQDSRDGLPSAAQGVYDGENNTTQGGVNVSTITSVGSDGITEAFDEPLDSASVLNIANLFIVQ